MLLVLFLTTSVVVWGGVYLSLTYTVKEQAKTEQFDKKSNDIKISDDDDPINPEEDKEELDDQINYEEYSLVNVEEEKLDVPDAPVRVGSAISYGEGVPIDYLLQRLVKKNRGG